MYTALLFASKFEDAHFILYRFLRGEESLEREKCKGLTDLWLHKHGQKSPGLTFNTLTQSLSKRVRIFFNLLKIFSLKFKSFTF